MQRNWDLERLGVVTHPIGQRQVDIGGNRGYLDVLAALRACWTRMPRVRLTVVKSRELHQMSLRACDAAAAVSRHLCIAACGITDLIVPTRVSRYQTVRPPLASRRTLLLALVVSVRRRLLAEAADSEIH